MMGKTIARAFLLALLLLALNSTALAARPSADAGTDITVAVGQEFNFDGSASTDAEDCPDGGTDCTDLSYTWKKCNPFFNFCVWQEIATGVNPAYTFTNAGDYRVRLTVTDSDGRTNNDEVIVHVRQNFACDFSQYFLGNDAEARSFAQNKISTASTSPIAWDWETDGTAVFYMEVGGDAPNITIDSSFLVGTATKKGALEANVYDTTSGTRLFQRSFKSRYVDPHTNLVSISNLSIGLLDILNPLPLNQRDRDYSIDLSFVPCPSACDCLTGTSADNAYNQQYKPLDTYQSLKIRLEVQVRQTTRGAHTYICTELNNVTYTVDGSQTRNETGYNFVTIVGNEYHIKNISNFTNQCTDGVAGRGQTIIRVTTIKSGVDYETFYNCTLTGASFSNCTDNITIELDSKEITGIRIERKGCDLYEQYYSTNNPASYTTINMYSDLLVFDPNDLDIIVEPISANDVYFSPDPNKKESATIVWKITNTSSDPRVPLQLTLGGTVPTAGETVSFVGPGGYLENAYAADYTETIANIAFKDEETTLPYGLDAGYTDKWGLSPLKTKSTTANINFFPPPADVLVVKSIKILPSNVLNKASIETFDVEVTLQNLSKAVVSPTMGLLFQNAITNKTLDLSTVSTPTQSRDVPPESERTFTFTGIPLKSNPEFEANKNYLVQAIIPERGVERIVVNNEMKERIAVVLLQAKAVPDMPPLVAVLAGLIVIAILAGKKK